MRPYNFLRLGALASIVQAAVLKPRDCSHDNCLRELIRTSGLAVPFCATYTQSVNTQTAGLPTYVSQCSSEPSKISSACSCLVSSSTTVSTITGHSSIQSSSLAPTSSPARSTTSITTFTSARSASSKTTTTAVVSTSATTTSSSSAAGSGSSLVTSTSSIPSSTPSVDTTADLYHSDTIIVGSESVTVTSYSSTLTASYVTSPTPQGTATALPIRIGPWDGTNNTLGSIKSGPSKKFLAGQDNGDGSYLLTVINLTAIDGSALINLEDFASSFADSVSCGTDTIEISFSSTEAATTALDDWLPGMGVITSGADLCGNDTKRTYYKLVADVVLLGTTATLAVQPAAISDVSQRMKLDYGTLQPNTVSEIAPEVGTDIAPAWDAIVGHFAGAANAKRCCSTGEDVSTTVVMSTAWWAPWAETGYEMPLDLLGIDVNDFRMICRECGFYATMYFSGGFDIPWFHPSDSSIYFGIDISDITVTMSWFIQAFAKFDLGYEFQIGAFSPFDLYIPGIMELGPTVDLYADIGVEVGSDFDVADLGFSITDPVNSGLRVSSDHGGRDYGWNFNFELLTPSFDTDGTYIQLSAGLRPALQFDLKILEDIDFEGFGWDAYFSIEVPEITATATAAGPGQECYDPIDFWDIKFEVALGADVTTGLEGDFIPNDWNFDIWNPMWPVYDLCVGIGGNH